MKRILFLMSLLICVPGIAQNDMFGQILQINTRFHSHVGKPTWLLIIREQETGVVSPYVYDIRQNDNFWIALTWGHTYRITVSQLKIAFDFGPPVVINDFCHLQSEMIEGKSMTISITGQLTPDRKNAICHVKKFQDLPFPIVTDP